MTVRRVVSIVAAVGLVAAGLVVGATPAHAGTEFTANVTKVVVGDPPPGTTFVVRVQCNGSVEADVPFDATGGTETVIINPTNLNCSVSEPQNGNANSTTFACENVEFVICDTSTFEIEDNEGEVNLTVTNTFVPAPAAVVPAAPTFTG